MFFIEHCWFAHISLILYSVVYTGFICVDQPFDFCSLFIETFVFKFLCYVFRIRFHSFVLFLAAFSLILEFLWHSFFSCLVVFGIISFYQDGLLLFCSLFHGIFVYISAFEYFLATWVLEKFFCVAGWALLWSSLVPVVLFWYDWSLVGAWDVSRCTTAILTIWLIVI